MNRVQKVWAYGTKIMPYYWIIITTIILSIVILPASASSVSSVISAELIDQEVQAGDEFEICIRITPSTAVAGAQLDLNFDSSEVTVNNVEEGDFFDRDNIMSIFIPGTIDNEQGTVSGLFAVTLGQAEVDSSGTFAYVTFTAGAQSGESIINLSNVILSDSDGNAIPVSIQNTHVTIIGDTTTTSEEVVPSSGGGGGGGGGDTGESAENIELKEVNKLYITGNTDVSYTFAENNNPVKAISYTSLKNAGFISTTIEVLKDVSTTVSQKPEGLIYRNMNIWVGKSGYATESNMEDMKISFAVLKNWVQVNSVDTATIHMNRYNEGKWQTLETEMTGEDTNFYFFESKTPGFSPFAITADMVDENIAENEQVNAASSYDDNNPDEEIAETEMEQVTDDSSDFMMDKTGSAKLSQNSLLLSLISISFIVSLKRRDHF